MLKVDLHVHAKVSKTIPFKVADFQRTVQRAVSVKLNGFALTEHFHSSDFWQAQEQLASQYGYRDGRIFPAPGFTVLTGAELTVADKADIILIGSLEALRRLDQRFGRGLSEGWFPSLAQVIDPAHEEGIIMIGAHPTRPGKRLVDVGEALLSRLDALEVNGKDMAQQRVDGTIGEWAGRVGLPTVGSSDAHLWPQVGVQRTLLPLEEFTPDGLKRCLVERATRPETGSHGRLLVHLCGRHKRVIKARIHASERQRGRPVAGFAQGAGGRAPVGIGS